MSKKSTTLPTSIEEILKLLASVNYVADRQLAVVIYLSLTMQRPLFLEGEAGVGKTEVARALATSLGRNLIRLQCYEGIDMASAAFEWDYPRQLLAMRGNNQSEKNLYTERFLLRRPLLQALEGKSGRAPVLLLDELDRTDEPFEAFLLEFLSDFQLSIPELGTIKAKEPPIVVITSNRTREVHDAIKRRCLYHWVDYPDPERETEILLRKLPEVPAELAAQIVEFVNRLRSFDMFKLPGVAETIDWAVAILQLGKKDLDVETAEISLGALLKYQDDLTKVKQAGIDNLITKE